MSLSKKFTFTESKFLEFRFDAINAFHTPIFAVGGYSTDAFPDGGIDKSRYGQASANSQKSMNGHG